MKLEEVEKELARLASFGVAAEVDSGMWIRTQVVRRLAPTNNNNSHNDIQKNGD